MEKLASCSFIFEGLANSPVFGKALGSPILWRANRRTFNSPTVNTLGHKVNEADPSISMAKSSTAETPPTVFRLKDPPIRFNTPIS